MHLWKPSALEVALIRDWLLNHNLTDVENKLACVILEGLNWGPSQHVCIKENCSNRVAKPPVYRYKVVASPIA